MNESLFPRAPRRMIQPRKAVLYAQLSEMTAEVIRLRQEAETAQRRLDAMSSARQHDHNTARRVPRWIRALFGA